MLIKLEILEFQFGNWFWEGKIGIFNKKIGDHYEKQKIDRCYSVHIVFIIALLHITSDK